MFLNLTLNISGFIRCGMFILLFFAPCIIAAEQRTDVKGIRYFSSPDYTRVVIDLSGPAEFSMNRLSNPERIYFDLKNSSISREIKTSFPVGDGILKSVRAAQFNSDIVRVVFDLEDMSESKSFFIDGPARLVIDLSKRIKNTEVQPMASLKRRIVIDAGHGGHDPGAVGPNNLYEKDVVLDIALKLRDILKADSFNEIYMTREKDIFIPLEERTAIANKKNADLFISIHANASTRRTAKGIETYLLNWTDDEEALKVAARENSISLKKMKAMNREMDDVETILSGLLRENKRDESIKLANYIQQSMVSRLNSSRRDVIDLGVKQALFYVLFGAKMPSVLVEVSFISNPEEENLLSQDSYRIHIAESIADGINSYISAAPVMQRIVEYKSDGLHFR